MHMQKKYMQSLGKQINATIDQGRKTKGDFRAKLWMWLDAHQMNKQTNDFQNKPSACIWPQNHEVGEQQGLFKGRDVVNKL